MTKTERRGRRVHWLSTIIAVLGTIVVMTLSAVTTASASDPTPANVSVGQIQTTAELNEISGVNYRQMIAAPVSSNNDVHYGGFDGRDDPRVENRRYVSNQGDPFDFSRFAYDELSSMSESCKYLQFCRWYSVNAMPMPQMTVTSLGQIVYSITSSLASIFFKIAGFIMMVIGSALIWTVSVDILGGALYTIDYFFARIATALMGVTGQEGSGNTQFLGWVLVIAFVAGAFGLAKAAISSRRGIAMGIGSVVRSMLIVVVGASAIAMLGFQSAKNHEGLGPDDNNAPVASMASGDGSAIWHGPSNASSSDYAPWSVGAIVLWLQGHMDFVDDVVVNVGESVSGAFHESGQPRTDSCGVYVDAMHHIFTQTKGYRENTGGGVLRSYDRLMGNLYFQNYKMAAYGDSISADGFWCRAAEVQTFQPTGDQVFISRIAGLYPEAIGTGPVDRIAPVYGSGLVTDRTSGSMVTSGGMWDRLGPLVDKPDIPDDRGAWQRGAQQIVEGIGNLGSWLGIGGGSDEPETVYDKGYAGVNLLSQHTSPGFAKATYLFGPSYQSPMTADAAMYYFAACNWEGGGAPVQLNPEWTGVLEAANSTSREDAEALLELMEGDSWFSDGGMVAELRELLEENEFGMSRDQCLNIVSSSSEGHGLHAHPPDRTLIDNGYHTISFAYSPPPDSTWQTIMTWLGLTDASNRSKFTTAQGFVADESTSQSNIDQMAAVRYYDTMTGNSKWTPMLHGILAISLMWLTLRYLGPIAIGGIGAELITAAAVMLLALTIIFLIFPGQRTKSFFKKLAAIFFISLAISAIITAIFTLLFTLASIFISILLPMSTNSLIKAILLGAGSIMAFAVTRYLVHHFTTVNLSTVKGGLTMALAPVSGMLPSDVAQNISGDEGFIHPFQKEFWRGGKVDPKGGGIATDDNTKVKDNKSTDQDLLNKEKGEEGKKRLTAAELAAMTDEERKNYVKGDRALDQESKKTKLDRFGQAAGLAAGAAQFGGPPQVRAAAMAADKTAKALIATRNGLRRVANAPGQAKRWAAAQGAQILTGAVGRFKNGMNPDSWLGEKTKSKETLVDSLAATQPELSNSAILDANKVIPNPKNIDKLITQAPGVKSAEENKVLPEGTKPFAYLPGGRTRSEGDKGFVILKPEDIVPQEPRPRSKIDRSVAISSGLDQYAPKSLGGATGVIAGTGVGATVAASNPVPTLATMANPATIGGIFKTVQTPESTPFIVSPAPSQAEINARADMISQMFEHGNYNGLEMFPDQAMSLMPESQDMTHMFEEARSIVARADFASSEMAQEQLRATSRQMAERIVENRGEVLSSFMAKIDEGESIKEAATSDKAVNAIKAAKERLRKISEKRNKGTK